MQAMLDPRKWEYVDRLRLLIAIAFGAALGFTNGLSSRRFPAPWTAEVTPNCFIVRDVDGQADANAPLAILDRYRISKLRVAASGQ